MRRMPAKRDPLQEKVYDGSSYRPFGEFTPDAARERRAALMEAAGFGPTMRVRPVAQAWGELATRMDEAGAKTVAELPADEVQDFALKLWVIQPGGGFMKDPPQQA
jgi:hypothetical protein